jgi:hypothetical protein
MAEWSDKGVEGIWRRRWDLNPRLLSQHTISNRADSAALARLRDCSLVKLAEGTPGETEANVVAVVAPLLGAVAGSCATAARESSQGRKTAALSGYGRVP